MKKLLLIDGHSIINRSFYGLPDLTNSEGLHTNGIYGFLNFMFRMLDEEKPDSLIVAFDVSAPTFRHELYSEYKGNRKSVPDELREQIPVLKELLTSMGVKICEKAGFEADDILGTLAKRHEKEGYEVTLVSGDRDLLQIASEHIKIRIPKTSKGVTTIYDYYDIDVQKQYGLTPAKFIELKALMGDNSDNVPGISGIGEKTAEKLMITYGSIDGIYEHIEEIKGNSVKEKLRNGRESLELSLKLVTINVNADIEADINDAPVDGFFNDLSYPLFKRLGFKNFMDRFETDYSKDIYGEVASAVKVITSKEDLDNVINEACHKEHVGIFIENSSGRKDNEEESGQFSLFDLSACNSNNKTVMAIALSETEVYFVYDFISDEMICEYIEKLYEADTVIATSDIRECYKLLNRDGENSRTVSSHFFAVNIGAYLLNPLKSDPSDDEIGSYYLEMYMPETTYKEKSVSLNDKIKDYFEEYKSRAGVIAWIAYKGKIVIAEKLEKAEMISLFNDVEMPVSYVIYQMEKAGVLVKKDELRRYAESLREGIDVLEKRIYDRAGIEFNINSPKQLGEILFERLGIEGGKKTKTGYSTSADVLEKLAGDYPIVKDILEYRTLSKLKSTYADGLSEFVEEDGRIHCHFNQTVVATGRLSSSEPNLQNIPTRYELGRRIRKVFVPAEGRVFIDADYSQIELRILASLSGDNDLIDAYREGKDIHAITASKVFHIPFEKVTSVERSKAKAVNFGIVYGISAFGLGQDLSISNSEAKKYIEEYFKTYPTVKVYLDNVKESAHEKGYSVTHYGRRRPIPELKNSNFMQRSFGERVAMNSPIQGTAADIMKIAMINVFDAMTEKNLKSKLILQVHDELIIETYEDEREVVASILRDKMENACDFPVKMLVALSEGMSWFEAK